MHLGVGLAPNYTLYYPARGQKNMVLIVITGRECTVLLSPNAKNQKRDEIGKKRGNFVYYKHSRVHCITLSQTIYETNF